MKKSKRNQIMALVVSAVLLVGVSLPTRAQQQPPPEQKQQEKQQRKAQKQQRLSQEQQQQRQPNHSGLVQGQERLHLYARQHGHD